MTKLEDLVRRDINYFFKSLNSFALPGVSSNLSFATYVNWWLDPATAHEQIQATPMVNNMIFNIAFVNWGQPLTTEERNQTINLYNWLRQAALDKGVTINVNLSYGGATYPFPYLNTDADAIALANTMVDYLEGFSLDFNGIDLDVESLGNASTFPAFVTQLRARLPTSIITLTVPGQGWAPSFYYQISTNTTVLNTITSWVPMEYNLWVANGSTFEEQIKNDIITYTLPKDQIGPLGVYGWGIPTNKVVLGLMVANDDTGQYLSPEAAQNLSYFSIDEGLQGMMLWDEPLDAAITPPFDYTSTILSVLDPTEMQAEQLSLSRQINKFRTPLLKDKQFFKDKHFDTKYKDYIYVLINDPSKKNLNKLEKLIKKHSGKEMENRLLSSVRHFYKGILDYNKGFIARAIKNFEIALSQ